MQAITLTEPWASLVAIGAKTIETRSWHTSYRGPIAIHAAKGQTVADVEMSMRLVFREAFLKAGEIPTISTAPGDHACSPTYAFTKTKGRVLATARLVACCRMELGPDGGTICVMDYRRQGEEYRPIPESELPFGVYEEGRFAWILKDVRRLADPIPAKGQLGLWEWEPPAELRLVS